MSPEKVRRGIVAHLRERARLWAQEEGRAADHAWLDALCDAARLVEAVPICDLSGAGAARRHATMAAQRTSSRPRLKYRLKIPVDRTARRVP